MIPISARSHDPGRVAPCLLGKEADVEAQQSVGAHLQQHAGQQHRSSGGRLHVRVGQPGVKRKEWHLDRKGDEEAEEEPQRSRFKTRHASAANRVLDDDKVETARLRIEPQNRRQHEHRADHREQEILHRGVDSASVAVHADQAAPSGSASLPRRSRTGTNRAR